MSQREGHTDLAALLGAASEGDQEAWNAITDRFTSLLWSVARSYRLGHDDAGDVVGLCQANMERSEFSARSRRLVESVRPLFTKYVIRMRVKGDQRAHGPRRYRSLCDSGDGAGAAQLGYPVGRFWRWHRRGTIPADPTAPRYRMGMR